MSRWDEAARDDEIAWLLRDLKAALDVRDALPVASRDRALVEETINTLSIRLEHSLSSSGSQVDDSGLTLPRGRRDLEESRALLQRADRQQPSRSPGA